MVDTIHQHNQKENEKSTEKVDKLSLREKVKKIIKKLLRQLKYQTDSLTQQELLHVSRELKELQQAIVSQHEKPDNIVQLDKLKQQVLDKLQENKQTVASQVTKSNNSTITYENIASGVDPDIFREENIQLGRLQAHDRVAQTVKDMFDPRNWSLV